MLMIWTSDLLEMIPFSRSNKGYKYLLMVIDVFSKYGWIIPIKTKTGAAVTQALKQLFNGGRKPSRFWTDKGKEYYNKSVRELLEKHHIIHYSTENEEKSSVAERWNRTIKRNLWKYFTANNGTRKYLEVLPALVEKYNNTYHRSIKCTPTEALDPAKYVHVFEALYGKTSELIKTPKFVVGDKVRISKKKRFFEKGFTENWSDEVFTVSKVKQTKPPTYVLKDDKNEEVKGTFYEPELQKSATTTYRIEKVLRRRTLKDGRKQEYVRWKGYDNSHNSWIDVSAIAD